MLKEHLNYKGEKMDTDDRNLHLNDREEEGGMGSDVKDEIMAFGLFKLAVDEEYEKDCKEGLCERED